MTAHRRRIAVVTGTRAEYGLLKPLMALLNADKDIDFRLVVCAAHLSPGFGLTKNQIREDGFKIDEEVDMLLSSDTPASIVKAVGLGCIGFSDVFRRMEPDLIVLLGDRFEVLAAAQAALLMKIPVAHLHGGELTEGAMDDAMRHAITKMAHLHFVAAEPYRRRVIQLGEAPERVFNFGAIGLDAVRNLKPLTRAELNSRVGIPTDRRLLLVSWHPETLGGQAAAESTRILLAALAARTGDAVIMSFPNADPSSRDIITLMERFAETHPDAVLKQSFGQHAYLSVMSHADAVVGNSSSGILEAPSLGVPTVNIGGRQQGRLRSPSVIDCDVNENAIGRAIAKALSPEFRAIANRKENPHGDGATAPRIAAELKSHSLAGILRKHFHDFDPAMAAR